MTLIIDPNKATPPPKRSMPPVEQVIAAICVDPMARYKHQARKSGSKLCQCGKRISTNAFACRECSLIYLDKAINEMDNEGVKAAAAGNFEKANEYRKAETKLRQFRADVHKGNGREMMV